MLFRSVSATFLCLALIAAPTIARGATRVFTPQSAVDFALQHNGKVTALREELGVREGRKMKATLLPNPVLELEGSTGKLSGSPTENAFAIGISQQFPTMGKRGKRAAVAEKELAGFHSQLADARRLVTSEVKSDFLDLQLAQKRVELAQQAISLTTALFQVTKEREEAGDIPGLEVNLARVEVARSQGRKVEAERDLQLAQSRLLTALGLPSQEEATFSGSLEDGANAGPLEALKKSALALRPDLQALEAERAAGDAEIALAEAGAVPDITAGITYLRENSAIEVGEGEPMSRDNVIALKLSMPLPLFDRNRAELREAHARRQSAHERTAFARLAVEREVEGAYTRLSAARHTVALYAGEILPQLEENLKLVQEAYRLGEVGILTVIEEHKKFIEVNDAYLLALADRQSALVKLEEAVGVHQATLSGGGSQ